MNGASGINNGERIQPSTSGSTTILKYEKSSCLFCNEWFDSQTFTEHLIHCGQVLEQCPNTCNVFVPRIRMRAHLKECPRDRRRCSSLDRVEVQILENEISTLRSVLNEEIRQRLHLITDVGNLRKQNQIQSEWSNTTEETITSLQKCLQEENRQRCLNVKQSYLDFCYHYHVNQNVKLYLESKLEYLEEKINDMSFGLTQLQNDNAMKLENTVLQNEKTNRDKFAEIENFLQEINMNNNSSSDKSAALDVEVKSMKFIVCETEERCEKLEKVATKIKQDVHNTMQLVSHLKNRIDNLNRYFIERSINATGHLIYTIEDFSKKLEDSKSFNSIHYSPIFSNKRFGYSLRLAIYLNGGGKWKGRSMIACLNVIAGEYDPLLSWPCRLQAEVILRDQSYNQGETEDYIKVVNVRKKSDDFTQTKEFFHIPHAVLSRRNYIKNDRIFVEVKILNI